MAKRILLALLFVTGCSKGATTKPGPLGEMDLATKLPPGVTVPADVKSFEATHKVCATGAGDEPVEVRVHWKAFTKANDAYVSSYGVELVKSVPGVTVVFEREPSKKDHPNANAFINANKTRSALLMATSLVVTCTRVESSKLTVTESPNISIRADGASSTSDLW